MVLIGALIGSSCGEEGAEPSTRRIGGILRVLCFSRHRAAAALREVPPLRELDRQGSAYCPKCQRDIVPLASQQPAPTPTQTRSHSRSFTAWLATELKRQDSLNHRSRRASPAQFELVNLTRLRSLKEPGDTRLCSLIFAKYGAARRDSSRAHHTL